MTQEEFREEYFYQILFDFRDTMGTFFQEKADELENIAENTVEQYLVNLGKTAERPVESIHISLLYSSYFEKILTFQLDSYGEEGHVMGETLLKEQVSLCNIQAPLQQVLDRWASFLEEEHREIPLSYVESILISGISPLFRCFITQFRYGLKNMWDIPAIETLPKTNKFYINLGEKGGWGKMIFAIRPKGDLLEQNKDTLYDFVHYTDEIYQDVLFGNLNLTWGVFRNCVFEYCEIKDFHWTDCHFHHCTFHNVVFNSGFIQGSQFHHCVFLKCTFDGVNFYQTDLEKQNALDRYIPVVFSSCRMNACLFSLCHLAEVSLQDCDITQLTTEISVVRDSDFLAWEELE